MKNACFRLCLVHVGKIKTAALAHRSLNTWVPVSLCVLHANLCMWKMMKATSVAKQHILKNRIQNVFFFFTPGNAINLAYWP